MSEIDKLINQAFPDELRDVEPISVDEDAILDLTLEKLGLEPSTRLELPEPVKKPLRRLNSRRSPQGEAEPEFVEVPVVVHHRWMDWAGWAIAACLVLVCAINWGPWLINNLDFGIGPRSAGETFSSASGSSASSSDGERYVKGRDNLVKGGSASVSISNVSYAGEVMTITMFVNDLGSSDSLDLDQFDVKLTDAGGNKLVRVSRSNEGSTISVSYDLSGSRMLVMTVRQLMPLEDGNGEETGFNYQDVEILDINVAYGYAISRFDDGRCEFARYDIPEAAPPGPAA